MPGRYDYPEHANTTETRTRYRAAFRRGTIDEKAQLPRAPQADHVETIAYFAGRDAEIRRVLARLMLSLRHLDSRLATKS